ncbi:NAD(P)H-hydrate dehydratase [Paracoccus sp. S-4012]|uniref:NAD(P)H-hydrate dehydratase n=1 Tax=Paracoccus sp. S-4012 TaxID=2665648 RepID=UPI0012B084D2|nr:NAD(P)H-hydrate dehydratase [Paracoccus sp. S-4012]MRX49079.1 NAD(P)H-hydrate dehydratase [Paracoccus sp. S-4012]
MTPLLTSAQMRALEAEAIAAGRTTGRAMMEDAGRGVAQLILSRWPGARKARVLAGPGNNGGDGYVVARHLAEAGWRVEVAALAPPATADAAAAAADWHGPVRAWEDATGGADAETVVVDALFGTGLVRPLAAEVARVIDRLARQAGPVVAADIASGICADSGRVLGGGASHDVELTVTFQAARPGHLLDQGGAQSGELAVIDLGLDVGAEDGRRIMQVGAPRDMGKHTGHKYDHGHALILAGPATRGGAARLAARAALRIGAGLVTVGAPDDALIENAARLDAVMLREIGAPGQLRDALEDRRISAVLMGPGLGRDRASALVAAARGARALVLDADALDADLGALPAECVLTPHDGEFARLCPDLAARLAETPLQGPAFSRVDAAREAAARLGAVVLLKGPDTVIAAPDGRACIHAAHRAAAAPWLATAGSGDVLAGLITGLLARGFPAYDAAASATWLHAAAARRFGPGLIAEDLPDLIPAVLRDLGA